MTDKKESNWKKYLTMLVIAFAAVAWHGNLPSSQPAADNVALKSPMTAEEVAASHRDRDVGFVWSVTDFGLFKLSKRTIGGGSLPSTMIAIWPTGLWYKWSD